MTKRILARLILAGVIGLLPMMGHANLLDTLVMPGPVIEGHAKFENDCTQCHASFEKGVQSQLCLACHKEVAADIDTRSGHHGRIKGIRQTECKRCHTDHKGRGEDIVRLDKNTFDHRRTDFLLKGAHAKTPCAGCHKPDQAYRKAPSRCIDCHGADEPHRGRLGTACADCHTETNWAKTKFDHGAKTKFPLIGKHREVTCAACHPGERYKNTPIDCVSCHRLNDVHNGRYGAKCDNCHRPEDWRRITFDHGKHTKFALKGRHAKTPCQACHTGDLYRQKLKQTCISCHQKDDEHKGRNGIKCQDCHGTTSWKQVAFDHNKDTKFPLRHKHAKLDCTACHKGQLQEEKLGAACIDCHREDDAHKGQEGTKCARCHNERGWLVKVFFDHDLTRFPLIGQHAVAICEECHTAATFKGTTLACRDCHAQDDEHGGRLGPGCGLCHNPNGWNLWRFDHSRQTDFPLDGAHVELACESCHRTPVAGKINLGNNCANCHRGDDVHRGRFGKNCNRCHVTESFSKVRLSP